MSEMLFKTFRFTHRMLRGTGLGKIGALRHLRDVLYGFTKPGKPRVIYFHDFKLLVDPSTASAVVQGLLLDEVHEPAETNCIRAILKAGMNVIDVGANIGYDTVLAATLVGKSGRVYAFEPESTNFSALQKNVELNALTNVTLIRKACSDRTQSKTLFLDPANSGGHHFYETDGASVPQSVEAIAIDDYFGDPPPRIDFVKMDIQGYEPVALAGMEKTLRANPGAVLITEFHPMMMAASGGSPEAFIRKIVSYGFEIRPLLDWPAGDVVNDPRALIALCGEGDFINLYCARRSS